MVSLRIRLVNLSPLLCSAILAGGLAGAAARAEIGSSSTTQELDLKRIERPRVMAAADAFLGDEPITITAFPASRSAGSLHDFFSEGDYWWPNPADPGGPYIQRDGMTNPDNFVKHRRALIDMSIRVATLTAAIRITGDRKYGLQAVKHLVAWFVAPATRMNPNLQFGQAIHGVATGRGTGIIDTVHLVEVARSVSVLERASLLAGSDLQGVKAWFSEYLRWMATHKYGLDEMNARNNHGTCWVMQAAEYATLIGDQERLAQCRKRFKEVLLPGQMATDGSFPQELRRTKPYGYSLFNLDAMATICQILSTPGDNLWAYATPDGRGMRKAVELIYPYVVDKSKWPYPHDVMYWDFWPVRSPALLFPGLAYHDRRYLDLWRTLNPSPRNEEVLRNLPIRQPALWVEDR